MRRVVTYVGFGIAILLIVMILTVGLLFLLPELSLFGGRATSVSLSNHYTRYEDAGIKAILKNRNIIIESNGIDIDIISRKYNQSAAGTIIVFENASGIAFNSIDRTIIDYLQFIDDDGEVWHKIVILEPQGAVSLSGYVEINLYANDEPELLPEEYRKPYNLIFNTQNSKVNIGTSPDSTYLRIDNIHISNVSGVVSIPTVGRDKAVVVDVGNLTVSSKSSVVFNCRAPIRGSVNIESGQGTFNMGPIGKEGEGNGDVTIKGDRVALNTYGGAILGNVILDGKDLKLDAGKVGIDGNPETGNISFKAPRGQIKVDSCRRIDAETVDGNVIVTGKIDGGVNTDGVPELKFIATGGGYCKVNQIIGVSRVTAVSGAVELRKVAGAVVINNRNGLTLVEFDTALDPNMQNPPTCVINAEYGNVTVREIIGPTNITAADGGKTRVVTTFRAINGESIINMVGDTNRKNRYHSVEVTLIVLKGEELEPFNLTVDKSDRARNNTDLLNDNTLVMTNGKTYHSRSGGSDTNRLVVNTDDWFDLYKKEIKA